MKNIKPKVWDKVLNKMADGVELIDFSSNTVKIAYEQYLNGERVHPLTWYRKFEEIEFLYPTDLKDKNGVDIYDGDILNVANGSINGIIGFSVYSVRHFAKGFTLPYFCWNEDGSSDMNWSHYCEVIGNIYENPELLDNA